MNYLKTSSGKDIYRLIFERSREAFLLMDDSLRIVDANSAFLDLTGYCTEDMAGIKMSGLIHPQDFHLCSFFKDGFAAEEETVYKARVIKKDKTFFNAELRLNRIDDNISTVSIVALKDFDFSTQTSNAGGMEGMFRASIDALPMWIACVDLEGRYLFANKYYSSTFKIPLENIEGHTFKEIFPPALYEKHKRLFDECIQNGRAVTFEDEADFENGIKLYTYGIYTPLFSKDKTVCGLNAAVFDITAKKELELRIVKSAEELKDSEEKYRSLVENSICGIGISLGDKIVYANKTVMKMFGYDNFEEFSSKKNIDYHTLKSRKVIEEWRAKRDRGEDISDEFEIEIVHKDGKPRTLIMKVSNIKLGDKIYNQSTFIDITERKKTAEKLKEWTDRYEYIVAASGQIAYDYNVLTGDILWGNTISKVLGYDLEEMNRGIKQWVELLHPEDRDETIRKLNESEEKGSFFDAEYRMRHRDGYYIWIRDRGFFIADPSGRAFKQLGMMEDITDHKKANDALILAKEQAEAANRAKNLFLANMSHEIRTPMNGIVGFTNLMASSGLNDRQKGFNDIIKASCLHLLELIDNILDFSKLEAKKLKLEDGVFDIRSALSNSINLVSEQADIKNLSIESSVDERINYKVCGDELRFKQILINLLTNAIKFTFTGKVGVSISQLSIDEDISNLSIEVYDTGIGISAEKTGEIFEMFHQLDESSNKRHGGSGIGLSIVKGLVEAMRGTVRVESEIEKGSRFTVLLPFKIFL